MRQSIALVLLALASPSTAHPAATLAVEHATIIDPTSGARRADLTILVEHGRIIRLGRAVRIPRTARRVDATGKFVIPGLWDMHVHLFNNASRPGTDNHAAYFPMFLANGVTGVRDMWTDPADNALVRRWRREMGAGRMIGPRIANGSSIIDGIPTDWPNAVGVADAATARVAVRREKAGGASFIKVYNRLSRPAFFAIADEAKRLHIPFAGHVPVAVTAREASDAGQRSIEHLTDMVASCSAREAEMRAGPENRARALIAAKAHDPVKCRVLAQHLARNGTAQDPTLTVHAGRLIAPFDTLPDPRLRFVDPGERASWRALDIRQQERDPVILRAMFGAFERVVRDQAAGGAMILAGTDLGNPHVFAGSSLHDELALLVQAGLSPREALASATINPARFLGLDRSLGTVERGRLADFVILDADPLVDIANSRRIAGVVSNGRYFGEAELDAMQDQAAAAAAAR